MRLGAPAGRCLLLVASQWLLACSESEPHPARADSGAAAIEIRYPREAELVRHDRIPIWLVSEQPEQFDRMTLRLNGQDVSESFRPWGPRKRNQPEEALAVVHPAIGENQIELGVDSASGERSVVRVSFRFEPHDQSLRIRTFEAGREVPARVVVRGLDGTPDPTLAPPIWKQIANRAEEETRNFLYTEGRPELLHLPPGSYELIASRGPSYSLVRRLVAPASLDPALSKDSTHATDVDFSLKRVLDTSGWISADFHVHALPSGDSSLPLWDRLVSYRAHDVDAIVATDHHTITDYQEDLAPRAAWPEAFAAIPGVESWIESMGHWIFWPLERDRADPGHHLGGGRSYGGYVTGDSRHPGELANYFERFNAGARQERFGSTPVVVQLAHPRGIRFSDARGERPRHDYLNRVGYDPALPLDAVENGALLARPAPGLRRAVDIDAIELMNRLAFGLYLEIRCDYFAWLAQGIVPAAMANSDSHWLVVTEAGFPRNWVRHDGSLPVSAGDLARAVWARQIVGSTGPLLSLSPWASDGHPIRRAVDVLGVTVRAAAWIPVEEVRVYVNGEIAERRALPLPVDPLAEREEVHRLQFDLNIEDDAFVFVEAGDSIERLTRPEAHSGPLGRAFPRLRILSFSNPLLIDARGDGSRWDAWFERQEHVR